MKGRLPKSRLAYWKPKIAENKRRDRRNARKLRRSGWKVMTLWQCQLKDLTDLDKGLKRFLK